MPFFCICQLFISKSPFVHFYRPLYWHYWTIDTCTLIDPKLRLLTLRQHISTEMFCLNLECEKEISIGKEKSVGDTK